MLNRKVPALLSLVFAAAATAGCGGAPAPATADSVASDSSSVSGVLGAVAAPAEEPPAGRLPAHTTPLAYRLELEIVPERATFKGRVEIDAVLIEARQTIWLHGEGMTTTAAVLPENGQPIPATFEQVSDDGTAALRLAEPVGPGKVTIAIDYEANFGRQLRGLYRVDSAGESYAFTQFEPTAARKAFPSFDEPAFKTPYDITLRVKDEHVALTASAEIETKELEGGMREHRFATTEKLPTYLVAFAVGPLDVVEAPDIKPNAVRKRPLPFRGVAVKGRGPELAYALKHTPAMVANLEAYFGVEYPYDKLDVVAVPDFSSGAMENVGLVTFRDLLLLVSEDGPEKLRQYFASIMAHELAHMWFGNYVTMPWWDDIWLNEAFATWMGHRVVRDLYPEYEPDLNLLSRAHGAMNVDSRVSARQIRQPIASNHDIENAFDSITYSKGGAVLSMVERYVTPESFRSGLRLYMKRHAFGSATATDLVTAIAESAPSQSVSDPFFSFLNQPGVPLVEASLDCTKSPVMNLSQSRYLPTGSKGDRKAQWQIPVCVRFGTGQKSSEQCALLTEQTAQVKLDTNACPSWLMPNAGAAGYYRWSMPKADLERLRDAGWKRLTTPERVSTAASLFAAMQAGTLSADEVLATLAPSVRTGDRHVLAASLGVFDFARDNLIDLEDWAGYQKSLGKLLTPRVKDVGLLPAKKNEPPSQVMLRQLVVSAVAFQVEDAKLRGKLADMGLSHLGMSKGSTVHPDLVGMALAAAVQENGRPAFDALTAKLFASTDGLERTQILDALSSVQDETLAAEARALALDERVRVNEVTRILGGQMHDPRTRPAAWLWVKTNYDAFVGRLNERRAGQLPGVTASFCSDEAADDVQAFFDPRVEKMAGGPREVKNAVEAIRLCATQRRAHRESAKKFFAN